MLGILTNVGEWLQAQDPALAGGDARLTYTGLWLVLTAAAQSGGRGLCLEQVARSPRATHTSQDTQQPPLRGAVTAWSLPASRRLLHAGPLTLPRLPSFRPHRLRCPLPSVIWLLALLLSPSLLPPPLLCVPWPPSILARRPEPQG